MEHQREMELKKEKELQPQLERLDEVLAEMGEIYHHVCDRNKFLALKLRQMNAAYAKQLEYQERTNETIRSLQEKVDMVEKSCEEKLNMVLTKGYMLMERSEEKVDMMLKSLQDIQQQLQERIENRQFVPCGGVGQQPPASLQEDSGEMSDETSIVTSAVSSSPNEPPEFVRQKCSNSLWQAYREWFYGDKCVTAFDKAYKNKWREKEPLRRWYFRNKKFMLELKKYIDLRPFPDSYHVSRLQVHIDTRFHSLNKLRDYVRQELEHRSATSVFNDLVCPPVEPTITPQLLGKLQLFA
ncbi:hypothetical protein TRVA0_070S00496 [Trichomonascus vanleenenianus]|uniref:uncharacterized protein n=1 Tax=Trichomonascus vanleenenianus TaxID=2268995 RepID=UPI003EC99A32